MFFNSDATSQVAVRRDMISETPKDHSHPAQEHFEGSH